MTIQKEHHATVAKIRQARPETTIVMRDTPPIFQFGDVVMACIGNRSTDRCTECRAKETAFVYCPRCYDDRCTMCFAQHIEKNRQEGKENSFQCPNCLWIVRSQEILNHVPMVEKVKYPTPKDAMVEYAKDETEDCDLMVKKDTVTTTCKVTVRDAKPHYRTDTYAKIKFMLKTPGTVFALKGAKEGRGYIVTEHGVVEFQHGFEVVRAVV